MADDYPVLAIDPSDEDLGREWTLSAADLKEVRRCRGDDNRHTGGRAHFKHRVGIDYGT